MPQLEVMLEVPQHIARGLASGQLERVGGVVREVGSKQVVAWLREGGRIAENTDLAGGVLKKLIDASTGGLASTATNVLKAAVTEKSQALIMQELQGLTQLVGMGGAASAATNMVNTAVTARSHFLIMQELQGLTNLVGVVGGIGVLNLGATVVSTAVILNRLGEIERAIEGMVEQMSKEFSRDRRVKMTTAIQAARDAADMVSEDNKREQANAALHKLFEARQHIWLDVETAMGGSNDAASNEMMQSNILQAMQLDMLRARCFMEIHELALAKAYLNGNLAACHEAARFLVHRHLGDNRALYFHKSIPESDLRRYIAIEFWLNANEDRLLQVVLANRHDFWNPDLANESSITTPGNSARFSIRNRQKATEVELPIVESLTQCELLIENHRRFLGFYAEVEAIERLGVSQPELERQQEEALDKAELNLAEHDDYVFMVDEEYLARQDRLSA